MKGLYIAPELEIIKLLADDVIVTSGLNNGGEGSDEGTDDGDLGWS